MFPAVPRSRKNGEHYYPPLTWRNNKLYSTLFPVFPMFPAFFFTL